MIIILIKSKYIPFFRGKWIIIFRERMKSHMQAFCFHAMRGTTRYESVNVDMFHLMSYITYSSIY